MRSQADVQAQRLSGGQKRRLSIAIAVVGDPKVLFLDEPTSGVDPHNSRFMWEMIRRLRKGRCIVVTTQSMQEADVYADRKLIMAHGKLRCAGTSLFLKTKYGRGYYLTMTVERDVDQEKVTLIFATGRCLAFATSLMLFFYLAD
jgi:ABC-type multidrug transport system ATPase subunit